MRKVNLFLSILVLMPFLLYAITSKKVVEKTYPFNADGEIEIKTNEGSLNIESWEQNEVKITMTMRTWGNSQEEAKHRLEQMKVDIDPSMTKISIQEKMIKKNNFNFFDIFDGEFWDEQRWRSSVVDFDLKVPRNVSLKILCDEGDADLKQIDGKLNIHMDEGNIHITDTQSSDISLACDEGMVRLINAKSQCEGSKLYIRVDEGNVFLDQCSLFESVIGADEGDVGIENSSFKYLNITSDEGNVDIGLFPQKDGKYSFLAKEGDILIALSDSANIALKLKTDEGRISSEFDLEYHRMEEGERLLGIIGKKDAMLKAHALEGDIELKELRDE